MTTRNDTIAAIATPPGRGGIAVIRVSGPDAFAIRRAVAPMAGTRFAASAFATFYANGERIDQGVVLTFEHPHSYTGEDVVEFQCHGGSVTPRRVLDACFAAGARLARRGEFTERAFLNGKIDLDQAESVLDLIDAKTERAADVALQGLAGHRQKALADLYNRALDISAALEHALDVDESDLPADFAASTTAALDGLADAIASALKRLREKDILRAGALVVLAGPPNVGKSSLMNALLEENRAIVSDVPGTTRDAIEAWLDLSGWPVRLVDTAGLRETADAIEAEGVRRSEDLLKSADVVLALSDSDAFPALPMACLRPETHVLWVRTKADLGASVGGTRSVASVGGTRSVASVVTSAKSGLGLDALKTAIVDALERSPSARVASVGGTGSVPSASAASLVEAAALLRSARGSQDPVLLANAARACSEKLAACVGATYSADLLDRLFSRFCVGK